MDQIIEFATANIVLAGIWVALVLWLLYSFFADAVSPVKLINTHETTLKINKEDAVVLDIRKAEDFRAGHIVGARQLKSEEIQQAEFTKLEKFKDKPIVVVCAMGMSAKKTAQQLHKAGFAQAFVLKGGMNSWSSAGLPVTK